MQITVETEESGVLVLFDNQSESQNTVIPFVHLISL